MCYQRWVEIKTKLNDEAPLLSVVRSQFFLLIEAICKISGARFIVLTSYSTKRWYYWACSRACQRASDARQVSRTYNSTEETSKKWKHYRLLSSVTISPLETGRNKPTSLRNLFQFTQTENICRFSSIILPPNRIFEALSHSMADPCWAALS